MLGSQPFCHHLRVHPAHTKWSWLCGLWSYANHNASSRLFKFRGQTRKETNGSVWESIGQPASVTGGLKHGDRGYVLFGAGCLAFGGLGAWGRKKNKMFEKGRGASGKGRAGKGQGQGAEPRFPPSSKSSAFSNYSTRTTTLKKFHSVSLLCSPSFNQSIRGAQPVTESWPSSPRILAASL